MGDKLRHKNHMPTLYLLHGWSSDPHNQTKWQPLTDALQQVGIHSTFLPIPGLDTKLDTPWQLSDYITWLQDQLTNDQAVWLLGHSFGGQLATRFAATHPQLVEKLILIDSSGIRDRSAWLTLKRGLFWLLAKVGKSVTRSPWARSALYRLAREKDYFQANPILRQTMTAVLKDEIIADAQKISCPTLIIWGQRDAVTPLHLGKQLAKLIPHSQFEVIEGARHSPHFTHLTTVVKLVSAFLKAKP